MGLRDEVPCRPAFDAERRGVQVGLEGRDRVLGPIETAQHDDAADEQSLGVARVGRERPVDVAERLLRSPVLVQDEPDVRERLRVVGVAAFTVTYAYLMTLRLRVGRLEEREAREALSPLVGAER